jgi:hypothetical protein
MERSQMQKGPNSMIKARNVSLSDMVIKEWDTSCINPSQRR